MVKRFINSFYVCECDRCKKTCVVLSSLANNVHSCAQAARSIGWSFGRNKKNVLCDECRLNNFKKY